MMCTPSPPTKQLHHRYHSISETPTRIAPHHRLPSPFLTPRVSSSSNIISLHSPTLMRTLQHSAPRRAQSQVPENLHSSDDQDSSGEDSAGDEDDTGSPASPATPAPRKHSAHLMLAEFSAVRRRSAQRSLPRDVDIPAHRVPPPRFNTTPQVPPRTPDKAIDEWRTAGGAESMTRLSINDKENSARPSFGAFNSVPPRERKRTHSTSGSAARYRKAGSPPTPIGSSESPTSLESAALFQSAERRPRIPSPQFGSAASPFGNFARFPPLSLSTGLSQETANGGFVSSPDPFPLIHDFAHSSSPFAPKRHTSLFHRPSSPHSNPSLSTSTSTTSNASSSFSVDDIPNLLRAPKRPSLARKYKPKSKHSTMGTDESDGGSGLGDHSFGSSSSLGQPNGEEISPLVVNLNEEPPFSLVTPAFEPSGSAGWPGLHGRTASVDPDEMLFHKARTAHEAEQANAKPIMPDTPMKKQPSKMRAWQSAGKPQWGSNSSFDVAGTLRGAPRKSLPVRLPDFGDRPSSPESDPSPSKPLPSLLTRPGMPERRKSSSDHGKTNQSGGHQPLPSLLDAVASRQSNAASPFLSTRTGLLRRTSSGAISIGTDASSEGSVTPTRAGTSKGPALFLQPPSNEESFEQAISAPAAFTAFRIPSSPAQQSMRPPPTPLAKRPSLRTIDSSPGNDDHTYMPSPFVAPKLPPPSPGPIKLFMSSRPSLHAPSPLRPAARRESQPSRSLMPTATSHQARIPSLFSGYASSSDMRASARRTMGAAELRLGHDVAAVRRPKSSSRLSSRRSMSPGSGVVAEYPGRFERDFVRPTDGPGVLGKGAFGQVFRVREKYGADNKLYAVKRSKPYEGERHRARLLEEVEVLRHLTLVNGPVESTPSTHRLTQGHDNVLHYTDAWEQDRTLYIRSELCELGTLSDFLQEWGKTFDRLDESRLWKILAEVSNGLHHIHRSGTIHLDLKPTNIFVTKEGRLRIGDFGMATRWPRQTSSDAGGGFEREGDREYLAAEILRGKYGPHADMFSFGLIMLEAAGNIVIPSNGEDWHRLRNDDFSDVPLAGLSQLIVGTITTMMASDYTARPSVEVLTNLDAVVRARAGMKRNRKALLASGGNLFKASAFAAEPASFLVEVLGPDVVASIGPSRKMSMDAMDTSSD